MNSFTIADIENLTNIKAHTIRIWEQRYGLCTCKRKSSNHRYYDGDDLKHILRIASLYHHGHKISHIACLSPDEIREKALATSGPLGEFSGYVNRLMEASIDFDAESFEKQLHDGIAIFGFELAMLRILFPFLHKLGLFWLTGHVIPAQEHFASALITKRLVLEMEKLPKFTPTHAGRRVLLFTPEGEYHELPLLFMKYLLTKNKVAHAYLGASVSIDSLQMYCAAQPVSELYFHLITNLTRCDINTYVTQLASALPEKKITASGLCCDYIEQMPANMRVLRQDDSLISFAR